jgi:uncharacterized repeat protein (TIGR01451 family)
MVFSLSLIAMLSLVSLVGAQTPREDSTSPHTAPPPLAISEQEVARSVLPHTDASASATITHSIVQQPSSGDRHTSSSAVYVPANTRPYRPQQFAARMPVATTPSNNLLALNMTQPAAPLAPPMAGNVDLALCLETARAWGMVNASETVTVTVNGAQMGASPANALGFFWTTLYTANGQRQTFSAGDNVAIRRGATSNTVTVRSISGTIDPLTNIVSGVIGGVSSPISVTVYVPWGEPSTASFSRTVTSDASGHFSADFTGLFDLAADDAAAVAYVQNGVEVHTHVYAAHSLLVRPSLKTVAGFAAPGSTVTVTLYQSDGVTEKEHHAVTASIFDLERGLYRAGQWTVDLLVNDIVAVRFVDGMTISRTVDLLTAIVDPVNDRVTGQAKPNALLIGRTDDLTANGYRTRWLTTTATASGIYTLNFSSLSDIMPGQWAGVYAPDAQGDDLNIWNHSASIEVNQSKNQVNGYGGPLENAGQLVTVTVWSGGAESTYTGPLGPYGGYIFDVPVDIAPGDVVTASSGSWMGVVPVMMLTVQVDPAANQFTGTVVSPTQRVELSGNYNQSQLYPANGQFALLATTTSPFTAVPGGFDVRGDLAYDVAHRTAGDYVERISRNTDALGAVAQWNAFGGTVNPPGSAYTVTLYNGSGGFKAQKTGISSQSNGNIWDDFGSTGQQIEPGDHLQIQAAAGFSYTAQILAVTINPDLATNIVSGYGPANALLLVGVDNQGQGFVPTDSNGRFAVAVNQLQEFGGNGQLEWGDNVNISYYDENNSWQYFAYNWPQIFARYQMNTVNDVFGFNAFPGNTIYFTVTHPTSGTIATGSTSAGSGGQGLTDYQLDFPPNALAPGNTVTANFGNGYIDAVTVVAITGYADPGTEIITGTAPANSPLSAFAQHRFGGQSDSLNNIQVDATGVYTADFKTVGWDIQYGDTFHVYYPAPHGHNVEYVFWLPAPDVSVNKWTPGGGYARPGGVLVYGIQYSNWGNGDAENAIITDTLPLYTTYAGDTSDVTPEIGAEGVITWNLGTLPPDTDRAFMVTLNVSPSAPTGAGVISENCAGIATTSLGDLDPGNDRACTGSIDMWNDEVEIGVDQWPSPNDPAPGQELEYGLRVCNNRGAAAGPIWLTDTLPLSTTVLSWWPENQSDNYWTEIISTGGQLVLYAPGLPGNVCDTVYARLRVEASVPYFTLLTNSVVAAVTDDVDLNNNQRTSAIHISPPRYDMTLHKDTNSGVLVSGGWIDYHISYFNQGNSPVHAWVTDTLPTGAAYQSGSAREQNGGPAFPPVLVTGQTIVWDLGTIGVSEGSGFDFSINISDVVTPTTILTNCATIGLLVPDDTPWDNTSCASETIDGHGPNLRVIKWSRWENSYRQLRYDAQFQNIGDQTIDNVWLTDTLPATTTFNWQNMDFDGSRLVSDIRNPGMWQLELSMLYPGDTGWLHFGVNLDNPDARPGWYTNTIMIDTPPGEINPADNIYHDVAANGEVNRVELRVANRIDMWGQAQPNSPLTITTPDTEVTTGVDGNGNWNINQEGSSIQPGDTVTVTAGNGTLPVVIDVPAPFDVQADSIIDRVWGRIDSLGQQAIEVDLYDYLTSMAQTDSSGYFTRTFADVPRGGNGEVRYYTTVDNADVVFHRDFQSPDLILTVNSSHDWVETNYESGHTIWITVTDSGGAVKATMVGTTAVVPGWGGSTGFSTNNGTWLPTQPDIVPGDWVYGALDNGYTSAVRVGTITGNLNMADDSITGAVTAAWFSQTLNAQCWIDNVNNSNQSFTVNPAGGAYACDFSAVWDLVPGQNVSVQYQEPDGDWVRAVFRGPTPHVKLQKQGNGSPGAEGNFTFRIYYENNGDGDVENTVITDTLLYGMTYLTDTTGLLHTGNGVLGDPLVWQIGTLTANSSGWFDVFVQVTATAGEQITNTAQIATSNPYDENRPWEYNNGWGKESSWWADVQSTNVDVNVGAGTWTWQPAPGYDYIYNANVCNGGSTSSAETTLTNSLPLSTSLVSWWSQNPGWSQVFSATHQLIVSRPTLSGGQCEQVFVRVHLDAAALSGDSLHYVALVGANNDPNSGNNQSDVWHNVGGPFYDLNISKNWNWGQLVPGGEVRYNLNYNNNGSLPVTTTIRITDTLPQNTTFLGAWTHDQQGQHPITPTINAGSFVVWEIPGLENGFGNNFEIALRLNPDMTPGTVFTNCATIAADFAEYNNPYDNEQCVADTVRASGPNLRVTKTAEWQNGGSQIQYRVRLENIGTTSISSVTVTDTYPVSLTLQPGWNINWNPWHANDDALNHILAVTLDSPFDPGNVADLNMQFNVPSVPNGTLFTNTAEITTPPGDVNPADNLAQRVSGTGPDLSVEKWLTGGSVTPRPGELLTYTLRLANKSTQWGTSGQTLITDTLPSGLEFIAAQQRLCGPGNFFCEDNPTQAGSVLTWTWGSWCPNCWNDLILTVRVTDTAQFGDVLANTAQIASANPTNDVEPDYTNNSSTVIVRVMNPKFVVGKVYQGNRVAGTVVTYTLTVTNQGNYTGTNVRLIDEVPANLTPSGTLSWTLASLAPQGTASVWFSRTLSCTADAAVNNTQYRVTSSDQAVTTTNGLPVSFNIAAPTITTDFSRTPDPILAGQSVAFTSTAVTNGTPLSYAWNFGDGAQGTGLNGMHAYTRHGTYTVVFTATDGCGFVGTQSHLVTVNAPALTANFTQSATSIIVNNTVRFTDTSATNGPSLVGWLWTFGDGSFSSAQHPMHTYSTVGVYSVTLLITDSLGYTATHFVPNAVNVASGCIPLTSADFTYTSLRPLIRANVTFTATAQPSSATQPITYAWNFGDGSTTTLTTATAQHAYGLTGARTVTLTVSNACTVSGVTASHTLTVIPYQVYLPLITRN